MLSQKFLPKSCVQTLGCQSQAQQVITAGPKVLLAKKSKEGDDDLTRSHTCNTLNAGAKQSGSIIDLSVRFDESRAGGLESPQNEEQGASNH